MEELPEPLPSERRRRKALAAEEALHGIRWRENLTDTASRKIYRLFLASTNQSHMVESQVQSIRELHSADGWPVKDIQETLTGDFPDADARLDCVATISLVLDQLAQRHFGQTYWEGWNEENEIAYRFDGEFFRRTTDNILLHHRIEWTFLGESFVERGNEQMHVAVVRPATELLGGDAKYASVQRAYEKALTELSNDDAGDAITDANSALQEAFRVIGVEGSSASEQAKKAQRKGLLVGYDMRLVEGIVKLCDWVNAERSQRGDAHRDGSGALKSDAWLVIHIVGALILRLAAETPRGEHIETSGLPEANAPSVSPSDDIPF